MILVIGTREDDTTLHLVNRLIDQARPHVFLDTDACLAPDFVSKIWTDEPHIKYQGVFVELCAHTVIFNRSWVRPQPDYEAQQIYSRFVTDIHAFLNATSQLVANRPEVISSHASKSQHMRELIQFGFDVPDYFWTTDGDRARDKIESATRPLITKGSSGVRTIAELLDNSALNQITKVRYAPPLIQNRIEGHEVRVHVVGSETFALRVDTQIVDYRYATRRGFPISFERCEVPNEIQSRLLVYCQSHDLVIAGADFIVCAETGAWYLLEVNPMPGFEFFDRHLHGQIADAIALLKPEAPTEMHVINMEVDLEWGALFISSSRRPNVTI